MLRGYATVIGLYFDISSWVYRVDEKRFSMYYDFETPVYWFQLIRWEFGSTCLVQSRYLNVCYCVQLFNYIITMTKNCYWCYYDIQSCVVAACSWNLTAVFVTNDTWFYFFVYLNLNCIHNVIKAILKIAKVHILHGIRWHPLKLFSYFRYYL